MKTILALLFALSLVVTPFAISGELSSADSNFVFEEAQEVTATTISDEEMEETLGEGSLLQVGNVNVGNNSNIVCVGVGANICNPSS